MPATVLRDVIYLDWERIQAMAVELAVQGPTPAWQFESAGESRSRSLRSSILRSLGDALDAAGKITDVSLTYDYVKWAPNMFADGQLVRISTGGPPAAPDAAQPTPARGMIRLLDYPWLSSVMETLPRMLKVSQRAELSSLKQKRDAHQITHAEVESKTKEHQAQLKDLENWKMEELTDVVRELFGSSVRLKIVPAGAARGEMFVAACPSSHFLEPPAMLSQRYGCDIDAPWTILGMINAAPAAAVTEPMPTGNAVEDMFERLALAVNRIHRVASAPDFPAFSVTPLAIWREV